MKSFDETYADHEFQQQIADAQRGWMTQVPQGRQPDLDVEGLTGSLFTRVLGKLSGKRS